jgi:hypothetical protein
MQTARVSLLFVCRSKKVESYVQVSAWLMEEEVVVIVIIHCKPKPPNKEASKAKQLGSSKAIGLGDQGNMLIAKESNKIYK